MTLDMVLTTLETALTELQVYKNEATDILTGAQHLEIFNHQPAVSHDTLAKEIQTYVDVIAAVTNAIAATEAVKEKYGILLATGYPQFPDVEALVGVVADITADRDQINKALAHLKPMPEATGGEILVTEEPPPKK